MADSGDVVVSTGSASTNGLGIQLTGTTSATAVELHHAVSGVAAIDVCVFTPFSRHTSIVTVTFEVTATATGGAATAAEQFPMQVRPSERAAPLVLRVNGGLYVRAFCSVVNVVSILPQVDSYTKST